MAPAAGVVFTAMWRFFAAVTQPLAPPPVLAAVVVVEADPVELVQPVQGVGAAGAPGVTRPERTARAVDHQVAVGLHGQRELAVRRPQRPARVQCLARGERSWHRSGGRPDRSIRAVDHQVGVGLQGKAVAGRAVAAPPRRAMRGR
jgi:hypothetical protein